MRERFRTAFGWYRAAADQKYAPAEFALAMSTIRAREFPSISSRRRSGIAKAAEQDHVRAQVALAFMNLKGTGMPAATAEAVRLFQSAAKHDDPIALYNIGLLRPERRWRCEEYRPGRNRVYARRRARTTFPQFRRWRNFIRTAPVPSRICGKPRSGTRRPRSGVTCRRNFSWSLLCDRHRYRSEYPSRREVVRACG